MDPSTRAVIEALHAGPRQCVLALTGGGATAAAQLLAVPGGSRTVLEVIIPYHAQALSDYLGHEPQQACSSATSRALAARALERALWLAPGQAGVGVGATASLATDRPKRGDHRVHVTWASATAMSTYSLTLQKGARDRADEEAVVAAVILTALADAFAVESHPPLPLLPGEVVQHGTESAGLLGALCRGDVQAVCIEADGRQHALGPASSPPALLPGAFNPIHHGHWGLREVAERLLGKPVAFELSVDNVDKPRLSPEEVRCRVRQFAGRAALWLTRAPTFADKARLFPGAVFVVGADTADRIVAPRYYRSAQAGVLEALALLRERGCRFLVAGRLQPEGTFQGLETVTLPAEYTDLFTAIPRAEFEAAISSTELRKTS